MPGMNGYELASRIAEESPELPVIFITAQGEEVDRWPTVSTSAVALLVKPFSEEEPIAALKKALGSDLIPSSSV